jgi:hypothetical protein
VLDQVNSPLNNEKKRNNLAGLEDDYFNIDRDPFNDNRAD